MRRGHPDEKQTVEAGITRSQGSIASLVVDSHDRILTVIHARVWPFSDMEMNFTLKLKPKPTQPPESTGGIALAVTPPRTRYVVRSEADPYLTKVNRVAIKRSGTRSTTSHLSCHQTNGSPWHRIQPESKRSPTLSQSPLTMPCRVCRCFWNPRSISQLLSMRRTRRHGLFAHRHLKTRFLPTNGSHELIVKTDTPSCKVLAAGGVFFR